MAALVFGGGLVLPAEHVHYAPDGQHAPIVHRHFAGAASAATALHGPDDDDQVRELRDAWLAGRPFVLPPAGAIAVRLWDHRPLLARGEAIVVAALRVDHGPPLLPRVLRGPPLPL